MKLASDKKIFEILKSDKVNKEIKKLEKLCPNSNVCDKTPHFDKLIENLCYLSDGKKPVDYEKRKLFLQEVSAVIVFSNKIPYLPNWLIDNPKLSEYLQVMNSFIEWKNKKLNI